MFCFLLLSKPPTRVRRKSKRSCEAIRSYIHQRRLIKLLSIINLAQHPPVDFNHNVSRLYLSSHWRRTTWGHARWARCHIEISKCCVFIMLDSAAVTGDISEVITTQLRQYHQNILNKVLERRRRRRSRNFEGRKKFFLCGIGNMRAWEKPHQAQHTTHETNKDKEE